MRKYELYDIVEKLNGGSIIPVGETNYDNEAFMRMKEAEQLIECFIDDMLRVLETKGNEASISYARQEARKWFKEMQETIDEILKEDITEHE